MKNVSKIGLHQTHELIMKLEQEGLTSENVQEIVASKGNLAAKEIMAAINKIVLPDSLFQKIEEFRIAVADDFSLKRFLEVNKSSFFRVNPHLHGHNYKFRSSGYLGEKIVVIYKLGRLMSSEEILIFRDRSGLKSLNAPGLAAVWLKCRDKFPLSNWTFAPDNRENLVKLPDDKKYSGIPVIFRGPQHFDFSISDFNASLGPDNCVAFYHDF
jgi:hypothetical protein